MHARGEPPASGSRPTPNDITPTAAELGLPDSVECPFCGGTETELHMPFGSRLSFATYWCKPCHSAFEWLRTAGDRAD
jgi:hypothetical protein